MRVSITNVSGGPLSDIRYRRTMDWDIEPTQFVEFVTIKFGSPAPANLRQVTDNGFESSNPLSGNTGILYDSGSPPAGTGVTDSGPTDHGANFDFQFGGLANGATKTFNVYYGGAESETAALAAVSAIGAEAYSLGQQSGDPSGGTPATFLFAFAGVGGTTVENKPGKVSARGTVTGTPGGSVQFSAANNCTAASSTGPSIVQWAGKKFTKTSVTSSACFDDPAVPGTPPSGFDTQTGKANGTISPGGAAATLEWKYVDGGTGASPSDKVQFTVKDASSTTLVDVAQQTPGPLQGSPGGVWTFGP